MRHSVQCLKVEIHQKDKFCAANKHFKPNMLSLINSRLLIRSTWRVVRRNLQCHTL